MTTFDIIGLVLGGGGFVTLLGLVANYSLNKAKKDEVIVGTTGKLLELMQNTLDEMEKKYNLVVLENTELRETIKLLKIENAKLKGEL